MKSINTQKGSVLITVILLISLLILVSIGVIQLILRSHQINTSVFADISARQAAEGAIEVGLLTSSSTTGINSSSDVDYDTKQNAQYSVIAESDNAELTIGGKAFAIIPLFTKDTSTTTKVTELDLTVQEVGKKVIWNIIADNESGLVGNIDTIHPEYTMKISTDTPCIDDHLAKIQCRSTGYNQKIVSSTNTPAELAPQIDDSMDIADFLINNSNNYLVLYNPHADTLTYTLTTNANFSLPHTTITGTSKYGKFKQNLSLYQFESNIVDLAHYSVVHENLEY